MRVSHQISEGRSTCPAASNITLSATTTANDGAITNVRNFVESVRSGKYLNNAAVAVESNLSCILGRTAGYERRIVTWDETIKRNEKLDARLQA